MTRDEVKQIVWQEINNRLNILLTGLSQAADGKSTEGITNILPGVPTINTRPVSFPWGFNASTPDGTTQIVLQAGNRTENKIICGHVDNKRPPVNPGEVVLYDAYGHQVYLSKTKMQFGSQASAENMVLGQIFKAMMDSLLEAIQAETHVGNLGYPTSPPVNVAAFVAIQESPIDDNKILSDKAFTEK